MGKAKIEQFLMFPSVYDQLEAEYKEADKRQDRTSEAAKPSGNRSCGIHTLKSVISTENGMNLMECVQKSTLEHAWKLPKPDKKKNGEKCKIPRKARHNTNLQTCPRLVWLQGNQTVNDQAFDSYTILGGPKRYIVTSNRIEDVEKWSKGSESSHRHNSENSSNEKASVDVQKDLLTSRNVSNIFSCSP
ncbi:hypothetical protein QQZ08_000445 [Neonectria magnoliae]|uniref:Uncharacterized protein n=1 Tax=Neonectria magnoliae TaxID=2732573 RepID=A0ABR1II44_9HYPO